MIKTNEFIILHHSATARDKTTFESIKNYHIALGWGDIGYNFLITGDGKIHKGRKISVAGAHCIADKMNYKSIGVCLTGNFQTAEKPSSPQLASLEILLYILEDLYNIPKAKILGHLEVQGSSTVCPGNHLLNWLKEYRNK